MKQMHRLYSYPQLRCSNAAHLSNQPPSDPGFRFNSAAMEAFFVPWLSRLDELHSDLLAALGCHPPPSLQPYIDAILAHYGDYGAAKARLADADILRAISHSWLTPFERTFLWIAGWKPSLAFRILSQCCVGGSARLLLSPDQRAAVEELRREVVAAEHEISEGMASAQEAMAGQAVLEAVRAGGARNENTQVAAATADAVARAFRAVVGAADELRDATLRRILGILTPVQAAEFLAAAAELRLRMRRWGLRRDVRTA